MNSMYYSILQRIKSFGSACILLAMIIANGYQSVCAQTTLGGVNLGQLPAYLFVFTNGSTDANWQGATKGFIGNVAINGLVANERTSGGVPFGGTIYTNDVSLGAWQGIISQNAAPSVSPTQAQGVTGQIARLTGLSTDLTNAFSQINALAPSAGYSSVSSTLLNGLNTQNGIAQTFVINITSGLQVSSQINITGDAGDIFILRWDTDGNPNNGYQGQVKFQSGGAIIPNGGLKATNFIHTAGDINASGGGSNPPVPYPQGPRTNDGTGALVINAKNFSGGGFFTGYWLTTGSPSNGQTASLSNAIFVGGWYSSTNKFSMTSGTSGVYVSPPALASLGDFVWNDLNRNGIQDAGEPGVSGVTVKLYSCAGALLATTQTSSNGGYTFSQLSPGSYYVMFNAPAGFTFTSSNQGNNGTIDSNPDSLTGITTCITLAAGENNSTIDAGITLILPTTPAIQVTQPTCFSATGSITVTIPLGAGYTYSINNSVYQISPVFSNLAPGSYPVTVKNNYGAVSAIMMAVIYNAPATPPAPVISGNLSVCTGNSTMLNAGSGYASYVWSNGATSSSITVTMAGAYTVTVSNSAGCTNSSSVVLVVNPKPAPAISGNIVFCDGSSTTLDAGAGFSTYLWSTGETSQTINTDKEDTYTVTVTNQYGCSETATVSTTIVPLPAPVITGVKNFCPGSSTILTASSGFTTYQWSTGETSQSITVNTASTFTVTVTSSAGCIGSATATTTFKGTPKPSINGVRSFCPGGSTTLSSNSTSFASYLWSTGETTTSIVVNSAGTYTLTVTNAGGCTGTAQATVTQASLPVCYITGNLNPSKGQWTTLCAPGGFVWLWSNGATTRCISVNKPGIYSVTITSGIGCSSTCSVTVTYPTRIGDTSEEGNNCWDCLKAYPNPFSSLTTIEYINNDSEAEALLEVYTIQGEKIANVYQGKMLHGQVYSFTIDGSEWPSGMYFCRLICGDKIRNHKLMINK